MATKIMLENYRPISLLPVISKIFEKLIHKRIMSFLDKQEVLYRKQFGFRKKTFDYPCPKYCNDTNNTGA